VRQVDLIVGGDHGGGNFRMTLKVNFRLTKAQCPFSPKLPVFLFPKMTQKF